MAISIPRETQEGKAARSAPFRESLRLHPPHQLTTRRGGYHCFRNASRVTSFSSIDSASSFLPPADGGLEAGWLQGFRCIKEHYRTILASRPASSLPIEFARGNSRSAAVDIGTSGR
jgi:hypothetical protein